MKMEFEGEKIRIRKLKLSDADDVFRNRNNKEAVKYTTQIPYPYSKKLAVKYIRRFYKENRDGKRYGFAIILKNTNKLIGCVSLKHVDVKNKNAEIGYWIGKKYWRKGLTSEAVKLLLGFGFKELKLHRIYGIVLEKNVVSQKVLEKFGFRMEGKLKDEYYRDKKWHNGLIYGLINKN